MTRHFFELSAFFFNRDHGVPLGRRVVRLKVAVSPGRDIMTLINAEGKRGRKRSRTQSEVAESSSGAASKLSLPHCSS